MIYSFYLPFGRIYRNNVTLTDVVTPLDNPILAKGNIYKLNEHEILRQVTGYYLIHAGVVSRDRFGVLLVADTLRGKTTWVLELVRRGYTFISYEMAFFAGR